MRACYWLSTAARPPPRPTHRARWSRLRARLAADGELFSYLRRDFDVNAENVAVSSGEVGRGLFFVKGSEANTTVKIPIHNTLLVTDDPTGGSSIVGELHLRRFQEIHGEFPELLLEFLLSEARWEVRLCAWLLWLMKSGFDAESPLRPHSPWRTYINTLPHLDDLSTLLSYSPLEQRALAIPKYIRESEIQRDVAEMFHYTYFYGLKAELGSQRLSSHVSQTIWAMSLVRSRSFGHTIDCEDVTIMAPFLDIANHSTSYNSSFRTTEDGEYFELFTFEHCNSGDELLISYGGDKCNFELMRDYGFVLEGSTTSSDRIHFVYECQCLLRNQGVVPEGAEAAAKVIQQARTHFMDEVTDGSYKKHARNIKTTDGPGLSFELLSAVLSKYRPIGKGILSYERAAVRSLEPLMSCATEHVDSADILKHLTAVCSNKADNAAVDTILDPTGNHVQWCKQEELASALQILCSELLKTQRDRVHFPDITISPHRQRAADLACQEHCRVLLAIYRLLQTYRRALTEQSRTIGNNLSGVQNEQASK